MADEFQVQAVELALRNMFKGKYYDICTVRSSVSIMGVVPPKTEMEALSLFHCVHYSEMPAGLREQLVRRTLALFRDENHFDVDSFFEEEPKVIGIVSKPTLLSRLLNA